MKKVDKRSKNQHLNFKIFKLRDYLKKKMELRHFMSSKFSKFHYAYFELNFSILTKMTHFKFSFLFQNHFKNS